LRRCRIAVIPSFVSAAVEGRPLVVHGDGKQTRDLTYVDSLTGVICDTIERGVISSKPVNLAFGVRKNLLELIADLEEIVGDRFEVQHTEPRLGDVRHSLADCSRLQELFPDVAPNPLEPSLRSTVDFFRAGCP
jgi:UDP-glucose 4-epimerase